jgi:ABC-type oligopeptide transport system substrate-binding subunit
MKKLKVILSALLLCVMVLPMAGCSGKKETSLAGVWEYADTQSGFSAVYDLKEDGTGTYTLTVGEETVVYELKYEVKENHLLVTYVNNETFSEEDVFDNEFSLKDANTLIIKDSFGTEMTFAKK